MKPLDLTPAEESVLNAVRKEPLTSHQILKKVDNIPMILSLYTIIDELKSKGAIKSFVKKNNKYHCAS